MHSNIDAKEGIDTIRRYITDFGHEIQIAFPEELIIKLLQLVMTNNINTWWLQKIDTAMGTLCACTYALIFFVYYERTVILQKYKNNIVTPLRYIDHILLIWKETPQYKTYSI